MNRFVFATAALLSLAATGRAEMAAPAKVPTGAEPLTAEQSKFFEAKVRPLLAGRCYKCHSAEEGKAKGDLTLDTRDGWQKGGKHGPAIHPGDLNKSLLLTAVRYTDPKLQMPPDGDQLDDAEIKVLEQWVKLGAPDPRQAKPGAIGKLTGLTDAARAHWAYQPVKSPTIPAVKQVGWVKTPIDAFVLAKLESVGMHPSPAAPREVLIRRATFDLIGLPPTPEEVADFVNDPSPDAFSRVVDRLLASPHYGERWGRHWLDTARYSDTTGQEKTKEEYRFPFAWTYRDYVIASFNSDKPYDQFLKEQIAADLLPDAQRDPSRLAALGFITVGKRFANPNDTIDERIDTLSKATLGLTVACARCHDHKFDPIPTADYYSLHGIFASTVEPSEKPVIGSSPAGPDFDDFQKKLDGLVGESRGRYFGVVRSKSTEFRKKAADYLLIATLGRKGKAEQILLRNKVIADAQLDRDVYGVLRSVRRDDPVFSPLAAFAQLSADDFAKNAPEALTRIERIQRKRQSFNPLVVEALSGAAKKAPFEQLGDVLAVYGRLFSDADAQAAKYIDACQSATTPDVGGFDEDFIQLINFPVPIEPAASLTFDRMRELAPQLPLVNQGGFAQLKLSRIGELMLTHPGSPARAMVVADSAKPKNSPIFIRGEQGNKGDIVPRQFLEILAGPSRQPFADGSGRLQLAEAIANKTNPLTARVMVNRIWAQHFGQGIVRTPDDLGVQSEPPSHPELLDYLATQFSSNGWSIKSMHRLILLSSTYQQSSAANADYANVDPANRLLWRANLNRLDFEAVRDSMLTFTGKLDFTIGGKPVNLTDEPYSNRRSVYGYIDRGDLPELMSQFDFADPDMANSRRTSTIVPQQALFFMNSPMAIDVARKVTSRPEFLAASDDAARVKALYAVLFQRPPLPSEVQFASDFLQSGGLASADAKPDVRTAPKSKAEIREARRAEQQLANRNRQIAAKAMKRTGGARDAIRNTGEIVDRKPLTVWEQYAQALLFTNEMVYVN